MNRKKISTIINNIKIPWRVWMALWIIALLLPISLKLLVKPQKTQAGWWNGAWQYRRYLPITNNTTAETDVYVSLTIDTSDTTKFQADCGDLRFTKYNGQKLPYYVSSGCGTASTVIHVNFDSFPAGIQNIYYYYGNEYANNGFSSSDFSTEASDYSVGSQGSEETTPEPILDLKFDEGANNTCSGGTNDACDDSGHQNDGAFSGPPTWQGEENCVSGKCLDFDGSDNYVSVAHSNILDFGNGTTDKAFSISAWVYMNDATNFRIFEKIDDTDPDTAPDGWTLSTESDDTLFFRFYDGGSSAYEIYSQTAALTGYEDQWIQITATYDGNKLGTGINIYLNGELVDQTSSTGGSYDGFDDKGDPLEIGRALYSSYSYADGLIDEVKIYPYTLSAEQAQIEYNKSKGAVLGDKDDNFSTSGLLGHWKFDTNTGTTAYDTSGNGYNGTLEGSPSWVIGKVGNALSFNGSNQDVNMGDIDTIDSLTAFTTCAWVKHDSLNADHDIVSNYNPSLSGGFLLFRDNVGSETSRTDMYKIYVTDVSNNTYVEGASNSSPQDEWTYVCASFTAGSSTGLRLYVNGIEDANSPASTTSISAIDAGTNSFVIGSESQGTRYFDGDIDDVVLYNYVLSQQQIIENMNAWHPTGGSPIGSQLAYWKFDEQYGQTVNDLVGSFDGTRGADSGSSTDDPTWKTQTNCKLNGCLDFDGTSDYVSLGDDNLLDGKTEFTISAWLYHSSLTDDDDILVIGEHVSGSPLIFWRDESTTDHYAFLLSDSDSSTGSQYSAFVPVQDTWTHVALTFNASSNQARLYINGEEDANSPFSTTGISNIKTTSDEYFIGDDSGHETDGFEKFFNGNIDEVKIYSSTLTADQVKIDYNSGLASNYSVGQNEATILTDGAGNAPIGQWRFDENTSTSAYDTSGNEYTGTLTGSPSWSIGKIGNALTFSGTDQYVDMDDIDAVDSSTAFTACAWVKHDTITSDHAIIAKHESGIANGFLLLRDDVGSVSSRQDIYKIYLADEGVGAAYIESAANASPQNEWTQVCTSFTAGSSTGLRLYINGVEDANSPASTTGVSSIDSGSSAFRVGIDSQGDKDFDGQIDNVVFYNYVRTHAQIAYDYNRGKPLAHYKLDECQGTTINDSSGNENHGTLSINGSGSQTSVGTCTSSGAWYNGSSGQYNASMSFDGTDDYITTVDDPLDIVGDITVSAWIKTSATGSEMHPVSKYDVGGDRGWTLAILNTGPIRFAGRTGASTYYNSGDSTTTVTDGEWHHITGVRDSNTWKIYVDADLESSDTGGTGSFANSSNLNIGRSSNGSGEYYFNGLVDDVRVYNYVLSDEQIEQVMNQGMSTRYGP